MAWGGQASGTALARVMTQVAQSTYKYTYYTHRARLDDLAVALTRTLTLTRDTHRARLDDLVDLVPLVGHAACVGVGVGVGGGAGAGLGGG